MVLLSQIKKIKINSVDYKELIKTKMGKLSIDDKQVGLSYLPIIANKVILNNSTLKQVITETLNLIFFP